MKIGVEVEEDCTCKIIWKRGPQSDQTDQYELNQYEPDVEADYVFTRISNFYSKDGGKTYDKKNCDFQVILVKESGTEQMVASIENHNMAAHVNKADSSEHIVFANSKKPNTFIDVTWNIFQTEDDKVDLKVDKMQLD